MNTASFQLDDLDRDRAIMVLGAHGQLGRQIVDRLRDTGHRSVIAHDVDSLDIANEKAVHSAVAGVRPSWVVNCAAMTNVDACQQDSAAAVAVNALAVGYLADACNAAASRLLQISTDFVFDGDSDRSYKEEDHPKPINVYGETKLLSEQHAAKCHHHLIVRTAWLFGPGTSNFVARILAKAAAGESLRIVSDRFGSPTCCNDLAEAIQKLMKVNARGIFHVVNRGSASWYELAALAVELAGVQTPVRAVASSEYPTIAPRPAYSVLDCSKYREATGHQLRDWQQALREYVESGRWMRTQSLPISRE